jgi:hypothetical protein
MTKEKITRGNAGQFFVAGALCCRGYSAVVTLGNTPNTDVLCSNIEGTKFIHIQVKTFVPGRSTCSVERKAEKDFGENFFWVLIRLPESVTNSSIEYFIIPSGEMAKNVTKGQQDWLDTPEKKGRDHIENPMRTVSIPPYISRIGWDISEFRDHWDLIEEKLIVKE